MPFRGIIIAESLQNPSVLNAIKIISTNIVPVTERHKTPWVRQWTMHEVEVPAEEVFEMTEKIRTALDHEHSWYADYKSNKEHFIIYPDKVFHITDRTNKAQYAEATDYGISIGIPEHQVDFTSHIQQ